MLLHYMMPRCCVLLAVMSLATAAITRLHGHVQCDCVVGCMAFRDFSGLQVGGWLVLLLQPLQCCRSFFSEVISLGCHREACERMLWWGCTLLMCLATAGYGTLIQLWC